MPPATERESQSSTAHSIHGILGLPRREGYSSDSESSEEQDPSPSSDMVELQDSARSATGGGKSRQHHRTIILLMYKFISLLSIVSAVLMGS